MGEVIIPEMTSKEEEIVTQSGQMVEKLAEKNAEKSEKFESDKTEKIEPENTTPTATGASTLKATDASTPKAAPKADAALFGGGRAGVDALIPGLFYEGDFISREEEGRILDFVNSPEFGWREGLRRRVKHFGYTFEYESLYIDFGRKLYCPPLPEELEWLRPRIRELLAEQWPDFDYDQLTINEYMPGQGIGFHYDTHSAFDGPIVVVSLESDINMCFRRFDTKDIRGQLENREYRLQRRSLAAFDHEAKFGWKHAIKSRKTDPYYPSEGSEMVTYNRDRRISLTFRKLNWRTNFKCVNCQYPSFCDTHNPSGQVMPERIAGVDERSALNDLRNSNPASPNPED